MSWCSIREYTERRGISASTARRQIQDGRVYARKFGRNWYVQWGSSDEPAQHEVPGPTSPTGATLARSDIGGFPQAAENGSLQSVVEFSSKALHHYLLLNEKLAAEKDSRLAEKDQRIVELEAYVKLLERELERTQRGGI